jgi:hypothetical protein
MAIEQAVDQVQVARATATRADGEGAREMGFGAGGEGGDLFVPHVNPFDLALATQGVRESIETVTHNAVNTLDASGRESCRELIRHGLGHVGAPSR